MVQKIVLTILERLDASIAMEVGFEKWFYLGDINAYI